MKQRTVEYLAKESLAEYLSKVSKTGEPQEWITEEWKENYIGGFIKGFKEGEVKGEVIAYKRCIEMGVITLDYALDALKMDKDEFLAFPTN